MNSIIQPHDIPKKRFGNGWGTRILIDRFGNRAYRLKRDVTWTQMLSQFTTEADGRIILRIQLLQLQPGHQ